MPDAMRNQDGSITSRVYARAGLLGNPSDGYGGKTLSVLLANFYAEVRLQPSEALQFLPNPEADPQQFDSLDSLCTHIAGHGYYGGIRLMQAVCRQLWLHCQRCGIPLGHSPGTSLNPGSISSQNFSLSYSTTIPRQCGLAGSSAIACATLNCVLEFYGLADSWAVPVANRPQLLLAAEADLGITAGLQDRVVQVYGGLVHMDFDPGRTQQNAGRGVNTSLDPALLPQLHLIYCTSQPSGKDSGSVHSDVRRRWAAGDAAVRETMQEIAALADEGLKALQQRDAQMLADLMRRNFALRRQVFGDAVVGPLNLRMVQAAASVGAAGKLTGSGGAVLALCPEGLRQAERLQQVCQEAGFACEEVCVGPVLHLAAAV